jgi:hypothetical protein
VVAEFAFRAVKYELYLLFMSFNKFDMQSNLILIFLSGLFLYADISTSAPGIALTALFFVHVIFSPIHAYLTVRPDFLRVRV